MVPSINFSQIDFYFVLIPHDRTLSGVNVKPHSVIKLSHYLFILNWRNVKWILSCPRNNNIAGSEIAVTWIFPDSNQVDMDFYPCLSGYCFDDQLVTSCIGFCIKVRGSFLRTQNSMVAFLSHCQKKGKKDFGNHNFIFRYPRLRKTSLPHHEREERFQSLDFNVLLIWCTFPFSSLMLF